MFLSFWYNVINGQLSMLCNKENVSQTWSFTRWCANAVRGCASQGIVIITGSNYLTLEVPEERGSPCFRNQFPTNYTTPCLHSCAHTCHYKYRPSGWSVAYQFPTYYKDHFTPAWAALLTTCLIIVDIIGQPPDLRHHQQQTFTTDIDLWVEQSPHSSSVCGLPLPGFTTNCRSGRCPIVKAGHW